MALQAHRTTLYLRNLPQPITLSSLRFASTSTYPYTINDKKPPPYPYGPTTRYRRRDSGLYGSTTIQFGNQVSAKNEIKTRRVWRPNVHNKRLWSNLLGKFVQVKVVTRVLRTIDKLGGLDEYLIGSDTPARVKELGIAGWGLRWRVMQTRGYRERVLEERRRLGLPDRGWEVEDRERRRRERREAMRVADAYLDAVSVEERAARREEREARWGRGVEEEVERATGEVVEELEASTTAEQEDVKGIKASTAEQSETEAAAEQPGVSVAEREQEEAENEVQSEFEVEEEPTKPDQDATQQQVDKAIISATPLHNPPPSAQLFTQLTTIATQIHSTPQSLIKQARDLIRQRTAQLAASTSEKARLATERASLVAEIDTALASPNRGPILTLYTTHLVIARAENALQREREGRRPLTREQIALHVLGPPSNIPLAKWNEVRARIREIKKSEPERLRERRERHARNVEKRKYWESHREVFLVEKKRKMRAEGVLKRAIYGARYLGKVPAAWWERVKGLVGLGSARGKEREEVKG